MPDRTIVRGDAYALRRPLWVITLVEPDLTPFDLTGCTVRTTYKAELASPADDPNDATAAIKHTLVVNGSGTATTQNGLVMIGAAADGVIEERLTAAESRLLPIDTPLLNDIEVTDANGEPFTFTFTDRLVVVESVTNRTTG